MKIKDGGIFCGKIKEKKIDCFWVWDTDKDAERAKQLERRVRELTIKQFTDKLRSKLKPNLKTLNNEMVIMLTESEINKLEKEMLR